MKHKKLFLIATMPIIFSISCSQQTDAEKDDTVINPIAEILCVRLSTEKLLGELFDYTELFEKEPFTCFFSTGGGCHYVSSTSYDYKNETIDVVFDSELISGYIKGSFAYKSKTTDFQFPFGRCLCFGLTADKNSTTAVYRVEYSVSVENASFDFKNFYSEIDWEAFNAAFVTSVIHDIVHKGCPLLSELLNQMFFGIDYHKFL